MESVEERIRPIMIAEQAKIAVKVANFTFCQDLKNDFAGSCILLELAGLIDQRSSLTEITETSQSQTSLDSQQVQALYDQYADGLLRFLMGVLKDFSAAEDACQLTFVRLVEKGHLVQQPSAIKSWLYQVAFNEALLIKRRHTTGQRHQQSLAWYYQLRHQNNDGAVINIAESMIHLENIEQVRAAINELSDVQREVVYKRMYEGKKFRQIAEELDVPLATVLSRMQLSLKKLKPVLENYLEPDE
jgi:RNA polymerase sigma factor (sigma-70 family)